MEQCEYAIVMKPAAAFVTVLTSGLSRLRHVRRRRLGQAILTEEPQEISCKQRKACNCIMKLWVITQSKRISLSAFITKLFHNKQDLIQA